MKFKVGQVWEDSKGTQCLIKALNEEEKHKGVPQPVYTQIIKDPTYASNIGTARYFTKAGWFGAFPEEFEAFNLIRLVAQSVDELEQKEREMAKNLTSKVIQISTSVINDRLVLVALCEDGSLWSTKLDEFGEQLALGLDPDKSWNPIEVPKE